MLTSTLTPTKVEEALEALEAGLSQLEPEVEAAMGRLKEEGEARSSKESSPQSSVHGAKVFQAKLSGDESTPAAD